MKIRTLLTIGGAIVVAMLLLSAWAWPQIPEGAEIPVHWGPSGEPDAYGPKWMALLGLPAVAAFVIALLAVIPRFEPRRENLARSSPAYVATGLAAVGLMAAMHCVAVVAALGGDINMSSVAGVAVGVMFVIIGNFMGKTRSNWFFGIRTPWTLSSDRSWAATHRLGGWLFIGSGLVIIATTLLVGGMVAIWAMLGMLFGAIVVLFAYSYLVWRDDPARVESGSAESAR